MGVVDLYTSGLLNNLFRRGVGMSRTIRYNPYHGQMRKGSSRIRQQAIQNKQRPKAVPSDPYDDYEINKEVWFAELGFEDGPQGECRTREEDARFDGSIRLPACKDRRNNRKRRLKEKWDQ